MAAYFSIKKDKQQNSSNSGKKDVFKLQRTKIDGKGKEKAVKNSHQTSRSKTNDIQPNITNISYFVIPGIITAKTISVVERIIYSINIR